MEETADGDWVSYTDFAAEVNRIVRKRIAKTPWYSQGQRPVKLGSSVEDEAETEQWELDKGLDTTPTEVMQKVNITRDDVRKMVGELKKDVEGYNQPAYDGNPHVTAVRTALGSVIYALKQGIK